MAVIVSALENLMTAVDRSFDSVAFQGHAVRNSLTILKNSSIRLSEWEHVVREFATGGSFPGSGQFASGSGLLSGLSGEDRVTLQDHLARKVEEIKLANPQLVEEFRYQFS